MAATRHEARGVAREPDGGTPGCPASAFEFSLEETTSDVYSCDLSTDRRVAVVLPSLPDLIGGFPGLT